MRSIIAACVLLLAPTSLAAQTLERLAGDGVVKLGYRETAIPFSFADPATGLPRGYSVALCEAIVPDLAAAAGVSSLRVEFVPVTAANRFDAVVDGRIDLLCGVATQTLARRERVDFSIPTFVDGAGVALRRGGARNFADLAGRTVAVTAGTTTEEGLHATLADMGVRAEVRTVGDHDEGLRILRAGEVDAYFADHAILLYLVARSGADDVIVADDQLSLETHALALPRGDSDFRLAVDRGLSRLYRSGEVVPLFEQAFGSNAVMSELLVTVYGATALPR